VTPPPPAPRQHPTTHHYRVRTTWSGSTGVGYEGYDRRHAGASPPATTGLDLSADPAFRGDPTLLNPEQLVVLAASSCQLLSFLAVAARARIDVLDYEDEGEGFMPEDDPPARISHIVLRPRIRVAAGPTEERVRHLVEVGHRECFIANSLTTEIVVEPTIELVDRP
jgi:organic hydroperoxide reductase OsmC/OhrA